jgi:hypothetical protein
MTDKKITRTAGGTAHTAPTHFDEYVDWINQNMKTVKAIIHKDEHGRRFFDLVSK